MIALIWHSVNDHALAALASAASWLGGTGVLVAAVFGAQVDTTVIVGVAMFIAGTLVTFLGWLAVVVVRATQVLARLEGQSEDHERRLNNAKL